MEENHSELTVSLKNRQRVTIYLLLFLSLFIAVSYFSYKYVTSSPLKQEQSMFEVEPGMSVKAISTKAKVEGVVRSETLLYVYLTLIYDPTRIHAGNYILTNQDSVSEVARKLADSETTLELVSLTFPEGLTVDHMAELAEKSLAEFNKEEYLQLAKNEEGFLFPDTYYVPDWFTAKDLYNLQKQNFEEKVGDLFENPYISDLDKSDVIILASVIEREAKGFESMEYVSGILQNRLAINMPLQADVTVEYVTDTPLNELKPGELANTLRDLDSPYNTYKNIGLPPTAIGNPGINAIKAALFPKQSEYFYYITDSAGEFHYAKTLREHNLNVSTYLR